jgi:hypothetical protein
MKWIALMVVVGFVAACGGGSSGDDAGIASTSTSSSSTTSTTTAPDPSQLNTALLAVSDLPPGWGAPPPEDDEDDDSSSSPLCDGKRSPFEDTVDDVEVSFGKGGLLPQLHEALAVLPEEEARTRFSAARELFTSCLGKTWSATDEDGDTTTYTMGEVSMPHIGDEDFAVRINAATGFGNVSIDAIVFRDGPVVGLLGGIGGSVAIVGSGQIASDEYVQIARAADRKVEDFLS